MRPAIVASIAGDGSTDVAMTQRFVMTASDAGWVRSTRNGAQIATHTASGGYDGVYNNSATGFVDSSRFVSVCEATPSSGSVVMSLGSYGSATSAGASVCGPQVSVSATDIAIAGSVEGASANTSEAYSTTSMASIPSGASAGVWSRGSGWAGLAAYAAAADKVLSSRMTGGLVEICGSLDGGATWVQLAIYTPRYTLGGPAQISAGNQAYYQSLAASPAGSVIYGGWI